MLQVRRLEALLVNGEAVARGHLARHLEREAERVVKFEGEFPGNARLPVRLQLLGDFRIPRLALVERPVEPRLLGLKVELARRQVLLELRVDVLILLADDLGERDGETGRDAELPREANGAADEAAQNVVRADVPRLHATLRIAQDKRRRAHMIGDNAPSPQGLGRIHGQGCG